MKQAGAPRDRVLVVLVVALFVCVLAPRPSRGEDAPGSLVDWLQGRGQDASFEARQGYFARQFPGEVYRGTAEQNLRLLSRLRGEGSAARARHVPGRRTGRPPTSPPSGVGRRTAYSQGWRLELDTSRQVLRLDAPKEVDVVWQPGPGSVKQTDPLLHATLPAATGFVSAAMLAQKAKIFDDGLYAAAELAAQQGHGTFPGKSRLLTTLALRLAQAGAAGQTPPAVVARAAKLVGEGWTPGSRQRVDPAVLAVLEGFWRDERRSKPLGFYTWSDALARIFRQDRLLQTTFALDGGWMGVVAALRHDARTPRAYAAMLELAEGLTNAFATSDLRPLLAGEALPPGRPPAFFPASRSWEGDLARRLWGTRPIPPGANLMDELIQRVRSGALPLEPREDSGWYDHQTWSLVPLLRPETTPEAARLQVTAAYREHLEKLFRGVLALMRETHVKQLELPPTGAMAEHHVPVLVAPDLTVEPLVTHYERRAASYAFVRGVLEQAFGAGSLEGLRRETAEGPVALDLGTELQVMERLFRGAAATARHQIGMGDAVEPTASADVATFDAWRALLAGDPDLTRDVRMMVPVFYDLQRRQTKVWVFLGWSTRPLEVSYAKNPSILEQERPGGGEGEEADVRFVGQSVAVAYPVTAEVYVSRLLDREQFRAHCDRFRTRTEILRNLR